MALPCTTAWSGQTVAATSQQACCLFTCDESIEIDPQSFQFLVVDALQRETGVDIAAIDSDDLKAAQDAARCSLGDRQNWCEMSPMKMQQVILYLLTKLLCS